MVKDGALNLDFEDEITRDTCVTHDGRIMKGPAAAPSPAPPSAPPSPAVVRSAT